MWKQTGGCCGNGPLRFLQQTGIFSWKDPSGGQCANGQRAESRAAVSETSRFKSCRRDSQNFPLGLLLSRHLVVRTLYFYLSLSLSLFKVRWHQDAVCWGFNGVLAAGSACVLNPARRWMATSWESVLFLNGRMWAAGAPSWKTQYPTFQNNRAARWRRDEWERQRSTAAIGRRFLDRSARPFWFHVVASRTFCHGIYLRVFEKVQRTISHWSRIGPPAFVRHVFQELVGGFVWGPHPS